MIVLSSVSNDKIKKYIKLKNKKYRDMYGEFIVEGKHTVIEAFKAGLLKELIVLEQDDFLLPVRTIYVTKEVINKISSVDTPQTVLGLCSKINYDNIKLGKRILVLDQLQDPGNLGTIIRSAVAFGIDSIVLSENTVDIYNPKVVRATQGMMFQVNIYKMNSDEIINTLKKIKIPLYGTLVDNGIEPKELSKKEKSSFALVMGNEGNGVRSEISMMCDKNLYIKMNDSVESLNVAIAASILLYELGR